VTVFQRKTRLVSFRLSEEEYEWLRHVAAAHGVRSVSDMARSAVRQALFGGLGQEGSEQASFIGETLTRLTLGMEQLGRRIDDILRHIDKGSSSLPPDGRTGPQ
jgi:vacuolar-type H+-ATPase subunit B/Vma2